MSAPSSTTGTAPRPVVRVQSASAGTGARPQSEISLYFAQFHASVSAEKEGYKAADGVFDFLLALNEEPTAPHTLPAEHAKFIEGLAGQAEKVKEYTLHFLSVLVDSYPQGSTSAKFIFLKTVLQAAVTKLGAPSAASVQGLQQRSARETRRITREIIATRAATASRGVPFMVSKNSKNGTELVCVRVVPTAAQGNCAVHALLGDLPPAGATGAAADVHVADDVVVAQRAHLSKFIVAQHTANNLQPAVYAEMFREIEFYANPARADQHPALTATVASQGGVDALKGDANRDKLVKTYVALLEAGKWLTQIDIDLLALVNHIRLVIIASDSSDPRGYFHAFAKPADRLAHILIATPATVELAPSALSTQIKVIVANLGGDHWERVVQSSEAELEEAKAREAAARSEGGKP